MLLQCAECHGKVSSAATACPHCGYPLKLTTARDTGASERARQAIESPSPGKAATYGFYFGVILLGISVTIVVLHFVSGEYFRIFGTNEERAAKAQERMDVAAIHDPKPGSETYETFVADGSIKRAAEFHAKWFPETQRFGDSWNAKRTRAVLSSSEYQRDLRTLPPRTERWVGNLVIAQLVRDGVSADPERHTARIEAWIIVLIHWIICFTTCRRFIRRYRKIGVPQNWKLVFVGGLVAFPCSFYLAAQIDRSLGW